MYSIQLYYIMTEEFDVYKYSPPKLNTMFPKLCSSLLDKEFQDFAEPFV